MFVLTLLVAFTSKSSLLVNALNVQPQWYSPFYYPAMGLAPWQRQYFYNYALQYNAYNPVYQPAPGLAPWHYQPFPNYGLQYNGYNPFGRLGDTVDPILGNWTVNSVGGKPAATAQHYGFMITEEGTENVKLKKVPDAVKVYKLEGYYIRRVIALIAKTTTGWKRANLWTISKNDDTSPTEGLEAFTDILGELNNVKVENDELVIHSKNDAKIVFTRKP